MEIRCSRCQHIGPAADVRPSEGGVELICAACGHANSLTVASGAQPSRWEESSESLDSDRAMTDLARALGGPAGAPPISAKAMQRLVPEPGPGPRCRKCVQRLAPSMENCPRCGLNVRESHLYDLGQAPWEQAPSQREQGAWEQAQLLWEASCERWSQESVAKFVDVADAHGFHEMAIRKFRQRLVDHPSDEMAYECLTHFAGKLHAKMLVARSQVEVSGKSFGKDIARARAVIVGGTLIFWGGIFLLFLVLFMDNCPR